MTDIFRESGDISEQKRQGRKPARMPVTFQPSDGTALKTEMIV